MRPVDTSAGFSGRFGNDSDSSVVHRGGGDSRGRVARVEECESGPENQSEIGVAMPFQLVPDAGGDPVSRGIERDGDAELLGQFLRDRSECVLGIRRSLGLSEMRGEDRASAAGDDPPQSGERLLDAGRVDERVRRIVRRRGQNLQVE